MDATRDTVPSCAYVVGDDGLSHWSQTAADAWIGLLQTHRHLTRELDGELEAQHGLGLSALELLGRLAAAEDSRMRLSALADEVSLSLSRVSRIIDALQARGLVERQPCPGDARAINAWLTPAGLVLVREAQATHFAGVQRRFFDRLSAEEIATLAEVFQRFAPGAARACSAQGHDGVPGRNGTQRR
ncbi:MAG: MarR family transcriptional regulator [Solirubrobacterales bacterium]|nr:MarR family transcriptional regulator [Solirubrobacterales bacterium]